MIRSTGGGSLAALQSGQIATFPYTENFDSATPPVLPAGWESTANRTPGTADMTVSGSAPRSVPNCVSAANATVAQSLTSPEFDFSSVNPDRISWYMRRSSTFSAPVVLEYSTDGGNAWDTLPGDTLVGTGSAVYEETVRELPRWLGGMKRVRVRWRIIPAASGTSGTLRFDDVRVTAHPAYDLTLVRVSFSPASPRAADPIDVTGCVKNAGLLPASGFSLCLYARCEDTLRPVTCTLLASSAPSPVLEPGDSSAVTIPGVRLPAGLNTLVAVVQDTADLDQSDNLCCADIAVSASPGGVVINEIMFAPLAGEAEYVELMNSTDQPVSLTGWRLTTGSGAAVKTLVIPRVPVPLSPGCCAVVAGDSGIYRFFPSLLGPDTQRVIIPRVWETRLNNAGEDIELRDPSGNVVDSVFYSPSWHNPAVTDRTGRSLERIVASANSNDPGNWSTCTLPQGDSRAGKQHSSFARGAGGECLGLPQSLLSRRGRRGRRDGDSLQDAAGGLVGLDTGVRRARASHTHACHVRSFHGVRGDSLGRA